MTNLNAGYQRSPQVRYRILMGEAVVLRQDAAEVFILNEIGARVLALLDGRHTLADIRDILLADYDVEESRLERDLLDYVHDLKQSSIVRAEEARVETMPSPCAKPGEPLSS